ncbi:MAG: DUF927 domain-containing protein [Pseudomonadales bacterium]|nr:DUF927 domain-containing protein [Pseudomonadales bacterium]
MSSFEHIHDFKQAMSVHGITPPETIVTDGEIHRFGHKKNGWYVFHEGDISGGAFGFWGKVDSQTWCSKQASQFNQAEREAWIQRQADIAAKVQAEKLAKQAEAAKKSIKLWADARPDVDLKHGYLLAKGSIYPHGIKQLGQALLIPVYGEDKQLTGCQFIYANGDKKFLTGTKKKGSFHFLKPQNFDPNNVQIVCIVEGWANGVTVLMAMNCLVFIAFDCGNLSAVAELARRKYPHALIVMCADVEDHRTGIKAASEAANTVNGVAAIPTGQTDENGKLDFNDVFKTHGIEAVKKMIDEAIQTKKAVPDAAGTALLDDDLTGESIDDVGGGGESEKQSFAYGLGRFEASKKGVFYRDDEGKAHYVCSPLWVKAKTRTGQGEAWGRLLEWLDDDGNVHQWAMPLELLEGDCADVRRELAHKGVSIEPSKTGRDRLAIYLKKAPVENRALCVERLGWYDEVYILPKQVIGSSKEIIVFQNPHGVENPFMQSGTVEQWRDNVARFAIGNTRFLLALSFAFGACLFELSQAESGGIHFLGASSIGKSTFLDAACSVWGKPKHYKKEWRNTANAIEGLCSLHNHGLLVLDEINQADIKTIGQTIYMIVNGQSKGRMSKNGANRPVSRWNTPFLSGGEKTLEALLKEAGQTINAGQAVRLANVRALVGQYGAFEQLHDLESGDTLSKLIKANANKHYGTVGITWLEYVAANKDSLSHELDTQIKAWLNANVPKGASGQVSRVASRFALIGIAGELATKQGLTGWPIGEANHAAKVCFEDWLLSFGGISNHEDRAILAHVKAFFEAHGSSRFEALEQMSGDKVEKVINRVGYWKQDNTGKHYLVFQESFKNEICKGFDVKQVIRVLVNAEILIKDKDGKSTTPARTPESPTTTRMYLINANMLFSGCNKGNRCNNDDFQQDFSVTPTKAQGVTGVTNTQESSRDKNEPDSVTPSHTFESERCNKEKINKINDVTPCTPVTPQKNDFLKNPENLGFSFDDVEVF